MRLSPEWMILVDERILELLEEGGSKLPSQIADDDRIHYGTQHVQNRCVLLADAGFIDNLGRGVYTITEQGSDYLSGQYDALELPKPE